MIPICVVSKEWLDAQANYALAKAYMDGFQAGEKSATESARAEGEQDGK